MFVEVEEGTERYDEYQRVWTARVVGTQRWGKGRSWHEALGHLVARHPELFGLAEIKQRPLERSAAEDLRSAAEDLARRVQKGSRERAA